MKTLILFLLLIPALINAQTRREIGRGYALDWQTGSSMTNTTTETTVCSQMIQGNSMSTNKRLKFQVLFAITSGLVTPGLTIRVKFGGSTLTVISGGAILGSIGANKAFRLEGEIMNTSATTQVVQAHIVQDTGILPLNLSGNGLNYADWTVDTTTDQTFAVTLQYGAALTGTTITPKLVNIEVY
ncbi:hypothetical protein GCM10027299_09350 [Larkinella ripae]